MQDWNYPMELPSWNADFTASDEWHAAAPHLGSPSKVVCAGHRDLLPGGAPASVCQTLYKDCYMRSHFNLSVTHRMNWGSQRLGYVPKATWLEFEFKSSCAFFCTSLVFSVSAIPSKSLSLTYPDPPTSSSNNKLLSSQYIYLFLVDSNRGKAVRCLFWLSGCCIWNFHLPQQWP